MENIDRRTIFAAGLAAASLISNTGASAQLAAGGSAEARLRELGIELPKVAAPVANYVDAARLGNVVFLAGQGQESSSRGRSEVTSPLTKPTSTQDSSAWGFSRRCGKN
jgi:hypothetical protein